MQYSKIYNLERKAKQNENDVPLPPAGLPRPGARGAQDGSIGWRGRGRLFSGLDVCVPYISLGFVVC